MGKEKWKNILLIMVIALVIIGVPYFIYWLGSLIEINYFGYINNWWIVLVFTILLIVFFIVAGISLDKKMGAFFLILFLSSFFLLGIHFGEKLEVDMTAYHLWLEKETELQKKDSVLAQLQADYFKLDEQLPSEQNENGQNKTFEVVFFQPGKADLSEYDQKRITRFIATLNHCTLAVNGYTDDSGDESFNLDISKKRAQNAADFIKSVDKGNNEVLSINGFGNQHPLADNTTELNRSKNRRVTIEVINRQDAQLLKEKQKIKAEIDVLSNERMKTIAQKDSLWQVVFQ